MSNSDFSNRRGCIHKERPTAKTCSNCGEPLCYDCYFEANIGQRVTARTSVDQTVQADYAFFCPACYLEWAKAKWGRLVEKPNIITAPFDSAFKYTTPGGCGYLALTLFLTPMIVGLFFWWAGYEDLRRAYEKQQKAFALLAQHSPAS